MADLQSITAIDGVREHLADRIRAGEFRSGDRLPSRSVLARQFGVSLGTVSLALRRLAKSHDLEFAAGRGVFLAREDAPREVLTIGLIGRYASQAARDPSAVSTRQHTYWAPIFQSIVDCSARQRHSVVLIPDTAQEPLDLDWILSHGPKCLVSHGIDLSREAVLEIKRRGVPLCLGRRPNDHTLGIGVSYVDYDWVGGLLQAMGIFAERGRRRVACIAEPTIEGACERWRSAFFSEAARLDLESGGMGYCRLDPFKASRATPEAHQAFLRDQVVELMDLPRPPEAIFCSAFEETMDLALEALDTRGVEVGVDLDLICLAPVRSGGGARLDALVQQADKLGERLVETAVKLAREPDQVYHVDVPFVFEPVGTREGNPAAKARRRAVVETS